MLSMRTSNRFRQSRSMRRPNSAGRIEPLEPRTLLNATLTGAISPVAVTKDAAATTIDLTAHFNDPVITGTAVLMKTSQGDIPLDLFITQTPKTVTNFLNYVNEGEYDGTVINRAIPGYILQGGSFYADQTQVRQIGLPVNSEQGPSNTVGTIAAALIPSEGPGSATSGWFINLNNNNQAPVNLDDTSNGGPFTVFGTVIYNGMQVVNSIANLPKGQVAPNLVPNSGDPGPVLPLENYGGGAITPGNYVTISAVQAVSNLTFSATSDNTAVVVPTISNGMLSLNYQPGQVGVAHITVTATDLGFMASDPVGHTVTTTFTAAVGTVLGAGGARQIRFTDADGTRTTLSLTGPGSANVEFNGTVSSQSTSKAGITTITGSGLSIATIALTGASAASTLNVSGVGGNNLVEIGSITADSDFRAINAARGAVSGNITIAGAVGRIQLASATGGTITINGAGGTLALVVGTATDESVNSSEAIASVQATSWAASAGGTSSPLFTAPSIGRFTVRQELNTGVTTANIGSASAGSITGSSWSVSGAVTTLTAGSITGLTLAAGSVGRINDRGAATNVNVNSAGNITSIAAQTFAGSKIEAGSPTLDANGIPTAFASSGTISSVTVGRGGFSNSVIGAPSLGRVNLGPVSSTNGGVPFGLAAHSIASLLATVDGHRLSLRNVSSADQVTTALTSAGITPNDLVIRIV
jgi:peptidyl-prolyl cis-trans isomerase A (cyclophilin A)